MKKVKLALRVITIIMLAVQSVTAQSPKTSGADTSNQQNSARITDTGFLKNNIRQQIIDIRLAQLAYQRAESPRVKQVASRIVGDGRDNLRRLLKLTEGKNLPGVTQNDIDRALGKVTNDSTISNMDPAAAATSGNTVTDSLGSGSTGSGNVSGQDTGTLARTSPGRDDANYSETGNAYAYNQPGILQEMDVLNKSQGKKFDAQWVQLMLRIHQGKIDQYNKAASQVKDTKLRMAITNAIPKIRLHNGTLLRLSKNKDISQGHENQKAGDDRINSGAIEDEK